MSTKVIVRGLKRWKNVFTHSGTNKNKLCPENKEVFDNNILVDIGSLTYGFLYVGIYKPNAKKEEREWCRTHYYSTLQL